MIHKAFALVLAAGVLALASTSTETAAPAAADARPGVDWPSFRGIRGSGVATGGATPVSWNVPQGAGVR